MNIKSPNAEHVSTLSRIAVVEYDQWHRVALAFHPHGRIIHSPDYHTVWLAVEDSEDAMAVWIPEHQMGYIVLPA